MNTRSIASVMAATALGLAVAFSGSTAATAATISGVTATTTTPLENSQPNAAPIDVAFNMPSTIGPATYNYLRFYVVGVTGSTVAANTWTSCGSDASSTTTYDTCWKNFDQGASIVRFELQCAQGFTAGDSVNISIAAGVVSMPASGDLTIDVEIWDEDDNLTDSGTTTLTIGTDPTPPPTPDSGGGELPATGLDAAAPALIAALGVVTGIVVAVRSSRRQRA